jgi:hypothetical protein
MHKRNSALLPVLFLLALVIVMSQIQSSSAVCTDGVCATSSDTAGPDVLEEKLESSDGTISIDATNYTFLDLTLDPLNVKNTTWGDNNSDFTWTFNCTGDDPAFSFSQNGIGLTGEFREMRVGLDVPIDPNTLVNVKKNMDTATANMAGKFNIHQDVNYTDIESAPTALAGLLEYNSSNVTGIANPRLAGVSGHVNVVNSSSIGHARGVSGGVGVGTDTEESHITGSAFGVRGGITVDNGTISNAGNAQALCLGSYAVVAPGCTVDNLYGLGIEHPLLGDTAYPLNPAHVGIFTGVGIGKLATYEWARNAEVGTWYGFLQAGNERNSYAGYHDTNTIVGNYWDDKENSGTIEIGERANYSAQTIFANERYSPSPGQWSDYDRNVTVFDLIGFKYETPVNNLPVMDPPLVGTAVTSYAIYLEDSEGSGLTTGKSWGIYQSGDDNNYFGGAIKTNSTLEVVAATYLSTLNATGAVDFDSTLHVDGASTLNSSLSVQGDVNFPGTTKVRAYLDGVQTIPANTDSLVEFEEESFDTLVEFNDAVANVFKAKNAGFYQVNANVMFQLSYSGVALQARILKNGTPYSMSVTDGFHITPPSFASMSISFSEIVELAINDTISVDVRSSVASYLSSASANTNLSIHRVP